MQAQEKEKRNSPHWSQVPTPSHFQNCYLLLLPEGLPVYHEVCVGGGDSSIAIGIKVSVKNVRLAFNCPHHVQLGGITFPTLRSVYKHYIMFCDVLYTVKFVFRICTAS